MNTKFYSIGETTTDTWLTPISLVHSLGDFDLDPAGIKNHPTAKTIYDLRDGQDGLILPWYGRVYLNPPYSNWVDFVKKLSEHNNGICLIYARTETKGFFDFIWPKADSILFIKRRIKFHRLTGETGSSTAPSVLIAYGKNNTLALEQSNIEGKLIYLQ